MIKEFVLRVLRRRADPVMLLKRIAAPNLELRTLVHVGAHLAQEREKYEACGYRDILWIEGSPDIHDRTTTIGGRPPGECRDEIKRTAATGVHG